MKNWTFMRYLFGDLMDLMQTLNFMNPYFWGGHNTMAWAWKYNVPVALVCGGDNTTVICIIYAKNIYIYI